MDLTLSERFAIIDVLPKKSDFVLLKQYRTLKEMLGLQPEEIKEFAVQINGENITWNKSLDKGKSFQFNDVQKDIVKKELITLDNKKILEERHLSIYEKFTKGD